MEPEKTPVVRPFKKKSNKAESEANKLTFLDALEKTYGIVNEASRITGIHRTTHYNWVKTDKKYADAVEELFNVQLDFVESNLFLNIAARDTAAITFYLKLKGRSRGYKQISEQDITISEKNIKFNFGNIEDDDLDTDNDHEQE